MNSKIDKSIIASIDLNNDKDVSCIVYTSDNLKAKKYFLGIDCVILKEFSFINAFDITTCINKLNQISQQDFITYIVSHSNVYTLMNVARNILKDDNSMLNGDGVNVCIIDTGIYNHIDFSLKSNRIIYFKDFVNNRLSPYDDNGHGTYVSGVCCGNGLLSNGRYCGIAPQSNIISLKALNEKGEAKASIILEAMQWVYDNAKSLNIKVCCMSFGSEPIGYRDPIMLGAEALWKKNICVVAAAGNSGPKKETIKSPGISQKIITVGGFDDNRIGDKYKNDFFEIADFSSRGPALGKNKPDLIAPSVNINSCSINNGYVKMSGTSVATPMIAGLASLIYQVKPNISNDTVKKILLSSCQGIDFVKNNEGYGIPKLSVVNKILNKL